jgi:hypothetical protein
MAALEGRPLFTAVTALTCLGFLLIGYDNGLMGGYVILFPPEFSLMLIADHSTASSIQLPSKTHSTPLVLQSLA